MSRDRFSIYIFLINRKNLIISLETFVKLNKVKPCGFLTDAFEKVLYLAELLARSCHGIKLLQSIVIHSGKRMATPCMGFLH